jgi:uncharacterized protein YndB with AHSA1/START domain
LKKILHVVSIDAEREDVFEAIASAKGLSSWWSTKLEATGNPEEEIRFTFHGDFHPVMKVTKRVENERIEWTCASGHEPWKDNDLSFALEDAGDRTQLTFVQDYARELSDLAYGTYNFNWGYYLNSLKQYCETGRGVPFEAE